MKKYDKITSRRAARAYLNMVDNSYLGSSDEVTKLMERVEATFIKHFSNSNRHKGINIFRPQAKRERHRITFSMESLECNMQPKTSHGLCLETVSGYSGLFSVMSTILAGVLGVGLQQISHADAKTADPEVPLPSESPSSYTDLEKIVKKKRLRLEELLKSRGMFYGSYPRFTVAMKGQKVKVPFLFNPAMSMPSMWDIILFCCY